MMIKRLALLLVAVPTLAFAEVSYNEEKSATHDCAKDGEVSINSSNGDFTFTGTCERISVNGSMIKVAIEAAKKITINGSKNTVAVDAADRISVNGTSNAVTYKRAIKGAKPKISKTGIGNKVAKVK